MNDYTELKRLAEAAIEHGKSVGEEDWYCLEFLCSIYKWASIEDPGFIASATPAVVLALIAENERLAGECEGCPMAIAEALRIERDQLKAENESLRNGSGKAADALAAARKALMVARPRTATHMELMTAALYAIDAAINQGEQA